MSGKNKSTDGVLRERINFIIPLVCKANRRGIFRIVKEQTNWNVSERQIDNYITKAKELLKEKWEEDRSNIIETTQNKGEKKMAKPYAGIIQRRISFIVSLLELKLSRKQIHARIKKQEHWDIERSTNNKYIRMAKEILAKESNKSEKIQPELFSKENEIVIAESIPEGIETITSVKFAEKINKQHKHVLRDIKKEIEELQNAGIGQTKFGLTSYKDKQNKEMPCYNMTEDGILQLAMKYSAVERHLALELIKDLKKAKQPQLPESKLEWMLLAVETEKKSVALQLENTAQKQIIGELQPVVDYTNEILKAVNAITITQIAKDYGLTGAKLNKILHDEGVQFKQSGQWMLYKDHHSMKYTETQTHKFNYSDGSPGISINTKWTQKGRLFIHDLLKKQDILAVIEREEK